MSASDIRSHYSTMLLAAIEDTEFPSPAMLARVESGIGDVATLEQYIELLMDKAQGRFPNLQLLDRINGLIGQLERMERLSVMQSEAA